MGKFSTRLDEKEKSLIFKVYEQCKIPFHGGGNAAKAVEIIKRKLGYSMSTRTVRNYWKAANLKIAYHGSGRNLSRERIQLFVDIYKKYGSVEKVVEYARTSRRTVIKYLTMEGIIQGDLEKIVD